MVNLSSKVALITGGSVAGELARRFLEAGSCVAFVYRNTERKTELQEEFADFSDVFLSVQADLADEKQSKQTVDLVKERFGGIDFLVNSLGGWIGGKRLHEHSASDLTKMISMDLIPTFNIMSATLSVMSEQEFGRIVNFISMQVFGSGAGNSIYAASKAAVLSLSKAAAEEYKSLGISVYTVAPSIIDTANNRKSMPHADYSKWVRIEEIVDAILFVCDSGGSLNDTILKFPGK